MSQLGTRSSSNSYHCRRIFTCLMLGNIEQPLIEIHLNATAAYIHRFVIVEAELTNSGSLPI
jgi:hypothetical protein